MSRRRRVLIALGILGVLAVAAVVLWPDRDPPTPTLRRLAHVEPGLAEAEVAAVIGPPARDVTTNPGAPPMTTTGGRLLEYVGERLTVIVEFDADGRFVACHPFVYKVTFQERVRLRLNWW